MNTDILCIGESDAIICPRGRSLTDTVVLRTGENYTDDGSDVSEATFRPKVVHLGQYVSNGFVVSSLDDCFDRCL